MYYIYISPIAQSGFLEIKMFPLFNFDSFQIKEEVFNKWPLFSTSNVTYITLLNCFFLEYSIFKKTQLSRVLVTLLVLSECLNGLVLRSLTSPEYIYNSHYGNGVPAKFAS